MQSQPPRFAQRLYSCAFRSTQDPVCRFDLTALHPKRPSGAKMRAELIPAKSDPTKSVVSSQETETVGVTRPLQSLAVLAMQIYALNATAPLRGQMRPRQANRPSVGAPADPRYGCAVTAVECDSGLARLHQSKVVPLLVALTGGELCLKEI
jgi:hypothetical protein